MKLLEYIPPEFHAFYEGLHSDDERRSKKNCKLTLDSSDDEN